MSLAQVQFWVAVVVGLIATWAGMLIMTALLLPSRTNRAEYTLENSPWKCFFSGIGMLLLFGIAITLAGRGGGLAVLGQLMILSISAPLVIGGAGLAQLIGRRTAEMSGARTSFGALVRGGIIYSLAVGFPYIGWLLFAPLSLVFALGAGTRAIWPRRRLAASPIAPNPAVGS